MTPSQSNANLKAIQLPSHCPRNTVLVRWFGSDRRIFLSAAPLSFPLTPSVPDYYNTTVAMTKNVRIKGRPTVLLLLLLSSSSWVKAVVVQCCHFLDAININVRVELIYSLCRPIWIIMKSRAGTHPPPVPVTEWRGESPNNIWSLKRHNYFTL